MPISGIDVSHWNGDIDWSRVSANGFEFVFIKASEGFRWHDSRFLSNWDGAQQAEIKTGAYHFFSSKDGIRQANNLLGRLDEVGFTEGDLLPVIDIEYYDADKMSVSAFNQQISRMVDKLTFELGQSPVIYTIRSFWRRISNPNFSHCPLWVVDLHDDGTPRLPSGWNDYVIHQYSHAGIVDGIEGDVDLNRFNGENLDAIIY